MQGTAPNGGKWFIFDSCVVKDPEEKAKIDRNVGEILARSQRRKFMEQLNAQEI